MKRCLKLAPPASFFHFLANSPNASWEEFKNDWEFGGQGAYRELKAILVRGQRCLCAYCELRLANGTDDETLQASAHEQRVEHFHPKSDTGGTTNWALQWDNMWAVCHGGSYRSANLMHYLEPLPDNLSCDAFKDIQITTGKLSTSPEGWILSPAQTTALPMLFQFSPDGAPEPHPANCIATIVLGNRHSTTEALVEATIQHLNLRCNRLNRARSIARAQLEKLIEQLRQRSPRSSSSALMLGLARRFFSSDPTNPWPQFFTVLRWRLGEHAEAHLLGLRFAG